MNAVYDLPADAEWDGVDPSDWRELSETDDLDDDQDVPASKALVDMLGFDPDEEF